MRRFATLLGFLGLISACAAEDPTASESQSSEEIRNTLNPALYGINAHPFDKSMERWGELMWKWIYKQPADHNPLGDQTGADCGRDQDGPVWFLPSIVAMGTPFVAERSCTIPRHKALLVQTDSFLNDFPCPDPAFHPQPGEPLYDFLLLGASTFIDTVNLLEVSIDGVPQRDMLLYRYTSENLFQIKGDPSLTTTLDGCVTGERQPAVTDGYQFMVKELSPGQHTIVWHATDTFGMTGDTTLTYHLTVK